MHSHIANSQNRWLPIARKATQYSPYSCRVAIPSICSKYFSKSSINQVTSTDTKEHSKEGKKEKDTDNLKLSNKRPKSSWVTFKKRDVASRPNRSDASSSSHSQNQSNRKWKLGVDISEELNRIKAVADKRRSDGSITQGDERQYSNSIKPVFNHKGAFPRKRAAKVNHAEIKRCIEILKNETERLGMFDEKPRAVHVDNNNSNNNETALDWWNHYKEKGEAKFSIQEPTNHYAEMLKWSEEGRLWTFPVNNEEGLEEEKEIPFYKHVFLDELLNEGFPKAGPVRKFMEVVTVGLSTNPYLTYKEKKEHINWFRDYFCEKKEILETLGAIKSENESVEHIAEN